MNRTAYTMTACLVVGLGVGSASAPAQAQPDPGAPVTPEQTRQAQQIFDEATSAYSAGEFGRAAALYQKAYQVRPEALFLYNAARAAQRADNPGLALELLRRATTQTERALPAKLDASVRTIEAELLATIEGQRVQARTRRTVDRIVQARAPTPPPGPAIEPARPLGPIGWTGVGVGALGLVGLGVMSVSTLQARQTLDRLEPPHASEADYRDQLAQLERRQRRGQLLLYTGTGLVALGAGLWVWDRRRAAADTPGPSDEEPSAAPTTRLLVGPGSVGVHATF